jgi:hypothetical protein
MPWFYSLLAFAFAALFVYGAATTRGGVRVIAALMAAACTLSGIVLIGFLSSDWGGKFWG